MLHMAEPFLEKNVHPTVIVRGYVRALEDAIKIVDELSFPIDTNDKAQMLKIVNSCIGTKFTNQFGNLMAVSIHTVLSTMSQQHADPVMSYVLLVSSQMCIACCAVQSLSLKYTLSGSALKQSWGSGSTGMLDCLILMQELALDAVTTVMAEASTGQREIDIKKYVKIEKIPGGAIEDCRWNTCNGHSFHAVGLMTV